MLSISYDDEMKMITIRPDSIYHEFLSLEGGLHRQKGNVYMYPLNARNIDLLFKRHKQSKDVVWRVSLKEAILKEIRKDISDRTSGKLLSILTLENIHKYPYLAKTNGIKPFANQHISQYYGRYCDDHAMLWEMGTGKTRAAIDIYEIKKKKGDVTNGIVVCPLSMLYKWADQIEVWSGNKNVCPLAGSKEEKLEILSLGFEWYIVTYETFERYKDEFGFIDEKWFVILDETTKIKNPKAKRTRACFELGLKTKHKVILTGTPVTQNAYDVFSQFRFLDGGKTFGFNYEEFINEYFFKNGFKLILKSGASEKISNLMFGKATRFLKKDCIDIPEKLYDTRILDMPEDNRKKYNEMLRWAITEIEGSNKVTAPIILTQLLRLSQITSGFVKDVANKEVEFKENPKLNALREILEEVEGKVIVWSRFKFDVDNILKLCKDMGIKAVSIYGEDNAIRRTENVRLFQEDPATKVIVGTASTGGHGIDLVAAQTVVYFSNSYSLEQRLQSEDRAHRAGQKNQVQYIDLLCKNTIDVSIYKILRNKKNIADMITKDNLRDMIVA